MLGLPTLSFDHQLFLDFLLFILGPRHVDSICYFDSFSERFRGILITQHLFASISATDVFWRGCSAVD